MEYRFFIVFAFLLSGCTLNGDRNDRQNEKAGVPEFVFQEEIHNFGSVQSGEIVAYSFEFKNSGNAGLIIKSAESDCGCVTVDYPKETIQPGAKGYIDVEFSSAGEIGKVYKEIVITSNTKEKETKLAITANVKNELINIYSEN